jgi:hypothetical protein
VRSIARLAAVLNQVVAELLNDSGGLTGLNVFVVLANQDALASLHTHDTTGTLRVKNKKRKKKSVKSFGNRTKTRAMVQPCNRKHRNEAHHGDQMIDRWQSAITAQKTKRPKKKKKKNEFAHLLAVDRARIGTNAQVLDAANNDTGREGRARVVEERREAGTLTVLEREVLRRPHRTVVADDGRASHALSAHQLIVNVCLPRHVFWISLYCERKKKKKKIKLIFFFFFKGEGARDAEW